MHGFILLYLFAFALGFHMNQMITASLIIHRRRSKHARHSIVDNMIKKCHYVNSLFSNSCPRQPFDGYNELYKKSYQMELLDFQKKDCFRKPSLIGVFALLFVIIISFINCLC